MGILETVWEFLTFDRVCLALIILLQFNLHAHFEKRYFDTIERLYGIERKLGIY
jgi:hypothetical protein